MDNIEKSMLEKITRTRKIKNAAIREHERAWGRYCRYIIK